MIFITFYYIRTTIQACFSLCVFIFRKHICICIHRSAKSTPPPPHPTICIFDNVLTTWACIYHCTWLVDPRGWRSLYDDIRSERKLFMVRNDNPHFSSHPVPTPPKELGTPTPVPGPGAEICSSPGCGSCCFLWFLLRHSTGRTLMGWCLVLTLSLGLTLAGSLHWFLQSEECTKIAQKFGSAISDRDGF